MSNEDFYIKIRSMIRKVVAQVSGSRQRVLDNAIRDGLPEVALIPCGYLLSRRLPDPASRAVAESAELRRKKIATELDGPVEIIYSPRPGSADDPERPEAGERLLFSPKRIANTGKDAFWGGFLHLCAREAKARVAIELGACAGLSAYYLGSAPTMEHLITIEGSAALAEIARHTLAPLGDRAEVIHSLFNEALDELLPDCGPLDLAYIDGHHERVATLTYYERLKPVLAPGAVVLFDDISWSQDMRDGWDEICRQPGLSACIDLGVIGLCIRDPQSRVSKVFDLREMVGVSTSVGRPHGWDKTTGDIVD